MSIRNRILLLISLPLITQLLTAGLLSVSLAEVDRKVEKEVKAKRALSLLDNIYMSLTRHLTQSVSSHAFEQHTPDLGSEKQRMSLLIKELKIVTRDNKQATRIVTELESHTSRYMDRLEEVRLVYNPGRPGVDEEYFAQFLTAQEFAESTKVAIDQIVADISALTKIYDPIAKELQPKALELREALRQIITVCIVGNALLVIVLVVGMNQSTLARLQLLMKNIRKFARGEIVLQSVSGNDELTELDKLFREVSEERNKLDEIRKAMRSMVNHDLRSPLTAINLRLDLLLDTYGDKFDANVSKQLRQTYRDSERLVRLASTLLDIDKLEDGLMDLNISDANVKELLTDSIESVLSLAERKSISIENHADAQLTMRCDRDRAIQVVINLLSNAIKFSPEQSTVTVKTNQAHGAIRVSFLDEGSGVPEDKVDSLFSKFKQLDQPSEIKQQGSGLGLYICKMLIEAQAGLVGYTSMPRGGCFWFELPQESK